MSFDLEKTIELGVAILGVLTSFIMLIVGKIKEIKAGRVKTVKDFLREAVIPLMEEAERMLDSGEEKENWVIKKLSLLTHIDFYTHKKELAWVKEIIANICKETKIEVNKNRIIELKEEKTETKEVGTNGVF